MSVRYAEYFWAPNGGEVSIFCNRGANGIDGTLSTAIWGGAWWCAGDFADGRFGVFAR